MFRCISLDRVEWEAGRISAVYALDDLAEARISFTVPGVTDRLAPEQVPGWERLASVTGLACFPLVFAPLPHQSLTIRAVGLSSEDVDQWADWYRKGLAEFFYVNRLAPEIRLTGATGPRLRPVLLSLQESAVATNGGGKDSVVACETLKKIGVPFALFTCNADPVRT